MESNSYTTKYQFPQWPWPLNPPWVEWREARRLPVWEGPFAVWEPTPGSPTQMAVEAKERDEDIPF